jgi:hypothetical protein
MAGVGIQDVRVGVTVVLRVPENPRLNGTNATVQATTEWGAHLSAPAAATGKFRALWSEIEFIEQSPIGDPCPTCGGLNLVRCGACLTCQDCGTSSGCS